jgi:hypothetical protein
MADFQISVDGSRNLTFLKHADRVERLACSVITALIPKVHRERKNSCLLHFRDVCTGRRTVQFNAGALAASVA